MALPCCDVTPIVLRMQQRGVDFHHARHECIPGRSWLWPVVVVVPWLLLVLVVVVVVVVITVVTLINSVNHGGQNQCLAIVS